MTLQPTDDYPMRRPCQCGASSGRLEPRGGQNCVFCNACGRLCYNAPKSETGEDPRSLASRPDIKPSQRARILERDNHSCISCGAQDRFLVLGHLISVKDGKEIGMSDQELYDDENLGSMCEECNAGMGRRTVNVRLVWRCQQIWRSQKG